MFINFEKQARIFIKFFVLGVIIFCGLTVNLRSALTKPFNNSAIVSGDRNRLGTDFQNSDLRRANLKEADFFEVDLRGRDLTKANLRGANLLKANLVETKLKEANLEGALLIGANLQKANLRFANLNGSDLLEANLKRANLWGANLLRADLRGANLESANLKGANLERADLLGVNLQGANLEGANLSKARIKSADLRGANLDKANLNGIRSEVAIFDRRTIFPKNFRPETKRMVENKLIEQTDPLEIFPLWWAFITDTQGNQKNLRLRVSIKEGFLKIFWADYGKTPILLENTEFNGKQLLFSLTDKHFLQCQLERQLYRQPHRQLYPRYFQKNYYIYVGKCLNYRDPESINYEASTLNITMASSSRGRPLRGRNLAPSQLDIKILQRALEILDNESVWNKADERVCDDDKTNGSWSMFCALYSASLEVTLKYLHSRPAMTEVRKVIEEVTNNQPFEHRIRDYNNSPETTFKDVREVLEIAIERLQTKVN